jgi:hypothetical protein
LGSVAACDDHDGDFPHQTLIEGHDRVLADMVVRHVQHVFPMTPGSIDYCSSRTMTVG